MLQVELQISLRDPKSDKPDNTRAFLFNCMSCLLPGNKHAQGGSGASTKK